LRREVAEARVGARHEIGPPVLGRDLEVVPRVFAHGAEHIPARARVGTARGTEPVADIPEAAYAGIMQNRADIECWLTDMDGVLVHENRAIPGAAELLAQWASNDTPFLVLTNNSIFTPRDLSARLSASGSEVPEERIWTSALAPAAFLKRQPPRGPADV